MSDLRPAKPDNKVQLGNAIAALRKAREWAKGADCPKTLDKIRSALKSAEGAMRHMDRRLLPYRLHQWRRS